MRGMRAVESRRRRPHATADHREERLGKSAVSRWRSRSGRDAGRWWPEALPRQGGSRGATAPIGVRFQNTCRGQTVESVHPEADAAPEVFTVPRGMTEAIDVVRFRSPSRGRIVSCSLSTSSASLHSWLPTVAPSGPETRASRRKRRMRAHGPDGVTVGSRQWQTWGARASPSPGHVRRRECLSHARPRQDDWQCHRARTTRRAIRARGFKGGDSPHWRALADRVE